MKLMEPQKTYLILLTETKITFKKAIDILNLLRCSIRIFLTNVCVCNTLQFDKCIGFGGFF